MDSIFRKLLSRELKSVVVQLAGKKTIDDNLGEREWL
jgi:hypothetical protein